MLKKIVATVLGIFAVCCWSPEPQLVEGGLYVTPAENGGYSALKILKLDAGGVHVRLYSNVFSSVPTSIDDSLLYMAGIDHKPEEALGMGHAPISKQSFASWDVRFVQQSTVTPEELEGYEMWREAKGGYF